MSTARENITSQVDEMISKGLITRDLRDNYINMLAGNETLAAEFNNRLAGGAHFTRRAQEDAENRRRMEAEIQAERNRLQQWEQQSRQQVTRLEQEAQRAAQLEAELAAYRQFVKDNNYQEYIAVKEPTQTRQPINTVPGYTPTQTQPDGQYLTREYAQGVVGDLLQLQRKGFQIAATHQQLFGVPLTDDIIGEAMQANQDPEQYYRAKYNVPQKEAELREREHQTQIAKIREEERAKLMAEYSVDPSKLTGNGSSMFPGMEKSALQSAYMERAAEARNPVTGSGDGSYVPPEKRPDLQMAANRVANAANLFAKHFNPDGKALTSEGSSLVNKHGDFSQ